jgi:hypothetical protein
MVMEMSMEMSMEMEWEREWGQVMTNCIKTTLSQENVYLQVCFGGGSLKISMTMITMTIKSKIKSLLSMTINTNISTNISINNISKHKGWVISYMVVKSLWMQMKE